MVIFNLNFFCTANALYAIGNKSTANAVFKYVGDF